MIDKILLGENNIWTRKKGYLTCHDFMNTREKNFWIKQEFVFLRARSYRPRERREKPLNNWKNLLF
jgi:hypothetical protein